MDIVARLILSSSSHSISPIANTLRNLNYHVCQTNNREIFVYRSNTSPTTLLQDIKTAKKANKFSITIKIVYGYSSATV